MKRFPILEKTGIRKFFAGPESFTPDTNTLLGEVPEVKNFFVCCGLNSIGIASAGGVGKVTAEWMMNGHINEDIFNYDIKSENFTNKILIGYDTSRWERKIGAGWFRARRYLTVSGGQANYNPTNSDNYQQMTINGITVPVPAGAYFDLENPFNGARNTSNYAVSNLSQYLPANLTSSDGVYVQNQFKLGRFSALLNLRYEWFTDVFAYKSNNEEEFKTTAFVPRIGITYEVSKSISAYAAYLKRVSTTHQYRLFVSNS